MIAQQLVKKLLFVFLGLVACFGLVTQAFSDALVIEDVVAWDGSGISNAQTLADIGIPYTKITSYQLAAYAGNLSDYDFVVYTSTQNNDYYGNIAANFNAINNYVLNGGVLIAHSCINGWNGYGHWNPPNFLPGGIGWVSEPSNSVNVLDPTSPVITGPYGTVTEADFQNWNYSTHGYFTGLPAGTKTIIGIGDASKPAYIEYLWGLGGVRATMMTVEWAQYDIGHRKIFRENEFYAAQYNPPNEPIPEPGTLLLLGAGLVGLAGYTKFRLQRRKK